MKKTKNRIVSVGMVALLCLFLFAPVAVFATGFDDLPLTAGATEFTYNGSLQALELTPDEGVKLWYAESESGPFMEEPLAYKDAGSYAVWVQTTDMNGDNIQGPYPTTLTIKKAPASIRVQWKEEDGTVNTNPVWSGQANLISVDNLIPRIDGVVDGETLEYTLIVPEPQYNNPPTHSMPLYAGCKLQIDPNAGANRNYDISYINYADAETLVKNLQSFSFSIFYRTRPVTLVSPIPINGNVRFTYGDTLPDVWEETYLDGALEEDLPNISKADVPRTSYHLREWDEQTQSFVWNVYSGQLYTAKELNSSQRPDVGIYPYTIRFNNSGTDPDLNGITAFNERYSQVIQILSNVYVDPKPVTISAADATKVYGEADPVFTGSITETAYGETIGYSFSREAGERVGAYRIGAEVDISQYKNYDIAVASGTLTITPRELVLVGSSGRVPYNGGTQTLAGYTAEGLVQGDRIVSGVSYSASRRDVGAQQGSFTIDESALKIVNAKGEDVTSCYTIASTTGSLRVDPVPATIYVDSFTKAASAADPTFTGRVEGLLGSDTLGSITYHREDATVAPGAVGTFPLTATYTGNPNYTVTVVRGSLLVTDDPVPPVVTNPGPDPGPVDPVTPVPPTTPGPRTPEPTAPTPANPEPVATPEPVVTEPERELVDMQPAEVPLAQGPNIGSGAWALLNLIIAVLALVMGVLLVVGLFSRRRREEAGQDAQEAGLPAEDNSAQPEEEYTGKTGLVWRLLAIITAVLSPIVFLLTENIRLPVTFVDKWTVLMVILLALQLVCMLLLRRARQPEEDEDTNAPPAQA